MAKTDALQGSLDLLVLKILSRRPRLQGYAIMDQITSTVSGRVRCRGVLALSSAVSDVGRGLDSRGLDQERHRPPGPNLRTDRRRQKAIGRGRVALAVCQPGNQPGSPGGM